MFNEDKDKTTLIAKQNDEFRKGFALVPENPEVIGIRARSEGFKTLSEKDQE